ncbi:hypothetical protein JR316_0002544 [Psilocybe cubensis]|uniref:Uncharacterized protein n=2 Tax=Psilocybe cubensis TaxID=181762 RepID=A0ACB8HCU1_PSICU|nr:hypothetical protein JR316_0002544 [Psilocybe cubensis]KAH9485634.1 hypothetical protein JR316_0002544 [Psilocybe cubensis]
MRAAQKLYIHPELSDSEVWATDAYNRSGKTRLAAVVAVFWTSVLSTVAVCQFMGYLDVRALQTNPWFSAIL